MISESARDLELRVDQACLSSPLIKLGRAQALWQYLAFCEDMLLKEMEFTDSETPCPQRNAMFTDKMVNDMKYPVQWIWKHCAVTGHLSRNYIPDNYAAAWELSKIASQYSAFERIFIYASAGNFNLDAVGNELVPSERTNDARFEAYDRLLTGHANSSKVDLEPLFAFLLDSVRVLDDRFKYSLNPSLVEMATNLMEPSDSKSFRLPSDWQFPAFSFGDFQRVSSTIRAIALVHHVARRVAFWKGCRGCGIRDAVLVTSRNDLLLRLRRYTGVREEQIDSILSSLTYANIGIRNPDPALQPIVPLDGDNVAISPMLWLGLNVERNFCVICNRSDALKYHYSKLSEDRSALLSESFRDSLAESGLRMWSGKIPGYPELPDIDLAIVNDEVQTCLVLELKAFIEPAEPREIIDRSKEIAKGISQVRLLRDFHSEAPKSFYSLLTVNSSYRFCFAVASQNSIGTTQVQDDSIAVVRASHLVDHILLDGLPKTIAWLDKRLYLPVPGEDFEEVETENVVAGIRVKWFGIRPLIHQAYY